MTARQVPLPAAVTSRKPASISMMVCRALPPPKRCPAPRARDWKAGGESGEMFGVVAAERVRGAQRHAVLRQDDGLGDLGDALHQVIEQPVKLAAAAGGADVRFHRRPPGGWSAAGGCPSAGPACPGWPGPRCARPSCQPRCSADMVRRISAGDGPPAGPDGPCGPARAWRTGLRCGRRGKAAGRVSPELGSQVGLLDPPGEPAHLAVADRGGALAARISAAGHSGHYGYTRHGQRSGLGDNSQGGPDGFPVRGEATGVIGVAGPAGG